MIRPRTSLLPPRLSRLLVCALLPLALAGTARGQELESMLANLPEGLQADADEIQAWLYCQVEYYVRAREMAEDILKENPRSHLAHLVLGLANHYAEANFPRALYHHQLALSLFERRHGPSPGPDLPWRWHVILLQELAQVQGDLERYSDQLATMARYNQLYDPDLIAERAWPLMKMRRFPEARLAAELGLATGQADQRKIALNALCAIEFEAGDNPESFRACRAAAEDAGSDGSVPSAVDLTNFAESARSLFKLEQAERIGLQATTAPLSWYANPWLELAELYLRQGRIEETLSALKEIPRYRNQRPPHVRESDRNETWRALSAFLLVLGQPREAVEITGKALVAPDRRGHASRDPVQDRMVIALLDRRARLVAAEMRLEEAAGQPFYRKAAAWLEAVVLRWQAWRSAALARRMLSEEGRLVGTFLTGTARSAVIPCWLVGELVDVVGAGAAQEAVTSARSRDRRPGAAAYYDAFSAEAEEALGQHRRALDLGRKALAALADRETLLRARVMTVAGRAARQTGRGELAATYYQSALQGDRGVFRRLGLPIPARVTAVGGESAQRAAAMLAASPRVQASEGGFEVRIEADRSGGSACLLGSDGGVLGCGEYQARSGDDPEAIARGIARAFHRRVFAPPIDLSRTDLNSLDGSNLTAPHTLDSILDPS